jgi:hypothetical protein
MPEQCPTCRHRRQEHWAKWRCSECDHRHPSCYEGPPDIAWYCDICDLYVPPTGFCWLHEPAKPLP